MSLAEMIYRKTEKFPSYEKFGLTSQMRKCAVAIASNIAEGAGRNSTGQFLYFLEVAMGSCNELITQLDLSVRFNYLSEEESEAMIHECCQIYKMISVLHRNLSARKTTTSS